MRTTSYALHLLVTSLRSDASPRALAGRALAFLGSRARASLRALRTRLRRPSPPCRTTRFAEGCGPQGAHSSPRSA